MHSKKHNDLLTIPIGLSTDNDTVVEMAFSCGGSSRGINGFQVFTPDETAIINHILENGRRKYRAPLKIPPVLAIFRKIWYNGENQERAATT